MVASGTGSALVDDGDSVQIKVFSKPEVADRVMATGVRLLVTRFLRRGLYV